jgi:hypothetical protein
MQLAPRQLAALAFDPSLLFTLRDWKIDAWQRNLLRGQEPRVLLNCCRQAGKSTVVAALALHTAMFQPGSTILLLSPTQRQSNELFRKVLDFYKAFDRPVPRVGNDNMERLELENGSRIESLPGKDDTVRGFSGVTLLILDEAAMVSDDLYRAVRPMLAVSRGRLICLSTPFGKRGFFYEAWHDREADWKRFEVRAAHVPRISRAYLKAERRALGEAFYRQEYECSFETLQGLVYPEFEQCLVDAAPPAGLAGYGGIDFGVRDPFAALWGFRDANDVLWITGEHYVRNALLKDIAAVLPRDVLWYADPAGARERKELLVAGFKVRVADNSRDVGIQAVATRLRTGRLKVVRSACPNLVAEAQLYRYPSPSDNVADRSKPVDGNDHALDALRYLILRLDDRYLVNAGGLRPGLPKRVRKPPHRRRAPGGGSG